MKISPHMTAIIDNAAIRKPLTADKKAKQEAEYKRGFEAGKQAKKDHLPDVLNAFADRMPKNGQFSKGFRDAIIS